LVTADLETSLLNAPEAPPVETTSDAHRGPDVRIAKHTSADAKGAKGRRSCRGFSMSVLWLLCAISPVC
jgi:hypothetical protein